MLVEIAYRLTKQPMPRDFAMIPTTHASDQEMIDLLQRSEALSIAQLGDGLQVTPTAIRQRLNRLMAEGLVERREVRRGRGRPGHVYSLTEKAKKKAGSNFHDLAIALWKQVAEIEPPEVRNQVLHRVVETLAAQYRSQVAGGSLDARIEALKNLLRERGVSFDIQSKQGFPVLSTHQCPYPELADEDPSICELETNLFSMILDQPIELSECRLHGDGCCCFSPHAESVASK